MWIGMAFVVLSVTTAIPNDGGSIDEVCRNYPEKVTRLFDALNLDRPDLAQVKEFVNKQDWPKACQALLEHYQSCPRAAKMRLEQKADTGERNAAADAILNDIFTLYQIPAKTPRRPEGGLDWTYNGPSGDKEWGWGLNRQYWVNTLLEAFTNTGNPVYLTAIDALIRDWIMANPYPGVKNTTPQWRGLEVFSRIAIAWPAAFYKLQDRSEFTPAARILMLSSVPDHAHYNKNYHAGHGNWVTMEMNGLAAAAAFWPEFKEADAWFDYAMARITPELQAQVYPDGAQKELTSSYHHVALRNFETFINLAEDAGRNVPKEFRQCIETMYNYLAYSINPAGEGPLNNDSDVDRIDADIIEKALVFNRPDWTYIATHREAGIAPESPASRVFPWAGHMVSRSGWDMQAHWSFFDMGPLGIGHQHYDKLHLSIAACGRDILVDGGRFTYQKGAWRSYFVGSASHNVILVDGHGQKANAHETEAPLEGNYSITPEYDFARGVFESGYENVDDPVTHTRALLYVRGGYWLVVDRVTAHQPHDLTALWHFHPECTVAAEDRSSVSTDADKGNARVVPDNGLAWQLELISGRESPSIQGWWSREYNSKQPNSCAAYHARIDGTATFAWLIVPAKGKVPAARATLVESTDAVAAIRVEVPEWSVDRCFRVPFKEGNATIE